MTVRLLNRMAVAVAISGVASFGLSMPAVAHPQQNEKHQQDKKEQNQGQAKKQQRLASQDQEALISQQRQRLGRYREHLDEQQRAAEQHTARLQHSKRAAQYGLQQQYMARLRQQLSHVQQSQAHYNYGGDPYFSTPAAYRYFRGGHAYQTNQYGLNLLRQAMKVGYGEGVRAGLADRQDLWVFDYEESFPYQDANDGYAGFYVDRDDYNYYFREGFRRGYEDAYYGRSQYGTYANGKGSMLGAVLASILTVEPVR